MGATCIMIYWVKFIVFDMVTIHLVHKKKLVSCDIMLNFLLVFGRLAFYKFLQRVWAYDAVLH